MIKRRPTMRDVAKAAGGLHPSTVSLALRNSPAISEETKKLVRKAAKQVGYRPDPLLDAYNYHRKEVLPHKTQPVIAFISDFPSRDALMSSKVHRAYWEGCTAAAETLHCKIDLFLLGPTQLGAERLHAILQTRAVSGMVVAGLKGTPFPASFPWSDYSAVKIESPQLALPSYSVSTDRRNAARIAWVQLRELGYKRVGLVLSASDSPHHCDLYEAGLLLQEAKKNDFGSVPCLHLAPNMDPSRQLTAWIKANHVDAVMSDETQLGTFLMQPETRTQRVAFASLDLTGASEATAGILPDHKQAGEHAVKQVVSLLRANDRGPSETPSMTFLAVFWRGGPSAPDLRLPR